MSSIPAKCRAALVTPEHKITVGEIDVPKPAAGQLLVRVRAAGVNHADIYQRNGEYPVPLGASPVLGLELAGEVAALGDGVKRFKTGDRVMALVAGGAYAEYAVVDEVTTSPLPAVLSFEQGAAIPESYYTVWSNVFDDSMAGLKKGETFLVHGGASGVGSVAVQLAKQQGATVIATAGTTDKCQAVRSLGADLVIPYKDKDFSEVISEFTEKAGVDVIFDWIGTAYFGKHVAMLKRFGRLVIIDSHTGDEATLDLLKLFSKNLKVMGSVLRRRPLPEKQRIRENVERLWMAPLSSGHLLPLVHGSFPLEQAQAAHELMERSGHTGKILITM